MFDMRKFAPRSFVCSVCDSAFQSNHGLVQHFRRHTGERPFACSYCPRTFAVKYCLASHERTHLDERPFHCHLCPRRFGCRPDLNVHVRVHLGIKAYACTYCPKAFVKRTYLTSHIRTHTGERPYPCSECDKQYNQRAQLNRHLKNSHGIDLPYSCLKCSQRFRLQTELLCHEAACAQDYYNNCQDTKPKFLSSSSSSYFTTNKNSTQDLNNENLPVDIKNIKVEPENKQVVSCDNNNTSAKYYCDENKDIKNETEVVKRRIKKYYCSCGKSYSSTQVFRKHRERRGHHRPRIHECPICIVETFKTIKGLERHFDFYHERCLP